MSVYEELSRLLDGELPQDEAEALRTRIATEPELAAAWETLQALPADLAELPDIAPPSGLDERVLDRDELRPRMQRFSRRWGTTAAVAASLALLFLWTRPGPATVLVSGTQFVDGQVTVQAAAVQVDVNGRALIEVEPPEGFVREHGQEVSEMNRNHLLSALAGAVVTVTVYQGAAVLHAEEAPPTTVAAGESYSVGARSPATAPPAPPTTPAVVTAGMTPEEREGVLNDEIERLRGELERSRMTGAIARGQLESVEGTPREWPDDLPDVYQPAAFEESIAAALEEVPFGDVETIDCSEYPCFAVVRSHDTGDDWGDAVDDFVAILKARAEGDDTGVHQHNSGIGRNGHELRYAGISFGPADGHSDRELLQRTGYRIGSVIEGLAEDALPDDEGE